MKGSFFSPSSDLRLGGAVCPEATLTIILRIFYSKINSKIELQINDQNRTRAAGALCKSLEYRQLHESAPLISALRPSREATGYVTDATSNGKDHCYDNHPALRGGPSGGRNGSRVIQGDALVVDGARKSSEEWER
jgi:hypothetical protein